MEREKLLIMSKRVQILDDSQCTPSSNMFALSKLIRHIRVAYEKLRNVRFQFICIQAALATLFPSTL